MEAEPVIRLGFIGIGLMGAPMARRLMAAGYPLTVWNRSADKAAPLIAEGAHGAADPAAVAAASDIVFACLTDGDAVEAALFGERGVAAGARVDTVFVDHSSIAPDRTRALAERLFAQTGMHFVDAPVSGGVPGAQAGTLAIMAGGDAAIVERVRAPIMAMAQRFTLMGPVGAGQTTKLCNQVIVGSTLLVICEAARLAVNAGIDAARLPEALAGGWADSRPLQIFVPRMIAGQHEPPLGHVATMLKDLDSVRDLARALASPTPMTALAAEQLRLLAAREGLGAELLRVFALSERGGASEG